MYIRDVGAQCAYYIWNCRKEVEEKLLKDKRKAFRALLEEVEKELTKDVKKMIDMRDERGI